MELNKKQLDTLRHMLGINTPYDKIPKPHRNYYAANTENSELAELQTIGAVEKYHVGLQYDYFKCTEAGKLAAMRSHREIIKTKAQRRYSKYLDISDCFPDLTFKDFLTHPEFEKCRKNV